MPEQADVERFIGDWKETGGSELANTQSFINGLCGLLGVKPPHGSRADDALNDYVFERGVFQQNGDGTESFGRIDAYKRNCSGKGTWLQTSLATSLASQKRKASWPSSNGPRTYGAAASEQCRRASRAWRDGGTRETSVRAARSVPEHQGPQDCSGSSSDDCNGGAKKTVASRSPTLPSSTAVAASYTTIRDTTMRGAALPFAPARSAPWRTRR